MNNYISLISLLISVQGNILDNIFGNYQAPAVNLPSDFHVGLGLSKTESPYTLEIDYSTKFKAAHIVARTQYQGVQFVVTNAIVNITANEIYVHNLKNRCQVFEGPSFGEKLQGQSGNPGDMIIEPEVVFRLMSLYIGIGDDNLIRYELSALLNDGNKAYALFTQEGDLDSLEFQISGNSFKMFVIDPLTEREFQEQDFVIPNNWKCGKDKLKISTIEELITKVLG